ncbi:hypothetical protein B7463_g4963, partial [Scytalidium lignicola]
MKTDNGFTLIYILTFPVNIFKALRLLVQNNNAHITSSSIFNKNNIKYSAIITSLAGIYLRLASIPTMLISAFPTRQTVPSLDIIHQRLAYASLEVVKNTIKATLDIDTELVKKASDEDPFLCKFSREKLDTFCNHKGIRHEETTPYTPWQNEVSERAERSIFTRTHIIIITTGIPLTLWNKVYKSTIYIDNRLTTRTLVPLHTYKLVCTSHITFTEGNLCLEELVIKAQDAEAVAEANSLCSLLSPPSILQDATLPPQLNSMFEEVIQPTKEEEEVSEDELPQVVVPTKRGYGRLKGSKNKKPEQGHTNSDIIHVDFIKNHVTRLQAVKSSTQAPSPVVSSSPVVSRAFPDEGEILGQPPAVAIAYSYYLTACSALNLGYALAVTDDPTEPKSYKEALDTLYSQE